MRAFDVLTKAEVDIRASMQPRYHLEMALLRWIHLRKLVPLSNLIQGLEAQAPAASRAAPQVARPPLPSRGSRRRSRLVRRPCRRGLRRRSEAVEARREQAKAAPASPGAHRQAADGASAERASPGRASR